MCLKCGVLNYERFGSVGTVKMPLKSWRYNGKYFGKYMDFPANDGYIKKIHVCASKLKHRHLEKLNLNETENQKLWRRL